MRAVFLTIIVFFSTGAFAKSILIIGDSISAGYGMALEESWVSLLQQRLASEGGYRVINASISGNTTTMGVGRTPSLLEKYQPDIVIIELGGNDGLQGHPLQVMEANLSKMVELSKAAGAQVLLAGIQIPPNYGPRYTREFFAVFPRVAEAQQIPLVPFILEGVATVDGLMQQDGIHPNAEAQPILLDNVWPYLEPLLAQ